LSTTEHTINDALADLLRMTRQLWQDSIYVRSENTSTLKGTQGQPDILITEPNISPVTIETEVLPATTVEQDALSRLGKQVKITGRTILASIAVRIPNKLKNLQADKLRNGLKETTDFEIAVFTGKEVSNYARWPKSGWIKGSINDLSSFVQLVSVPPDVIDEAADQLVNGVNEAAGLLEEMSTFHPSAIHNISKELFQEDSLQTRRMATTILANAFIFHETLAGGPVDLSDVKPIEKLRGSNNNLDKTVILAEWRKILNVNYWPIFDIARRILEDIPTEGCEAFIECLVATANNLLSNRLMRSHDLTGAVFQRLIADRKFLAAYYTTPASAALLVGLAIPQDKKLESGSWSNPESVKRLRIADFACGTGTLLSTAYHRIGQFYELNGGNAEQIHAEMMASSLIGCDVLPAASHLTASMLSGAYPTIKYNQSSIYTVPYGKQSDGTIALGSLELLDPQGKFEILSITAKAIESNGVSDKVAWRAFPHSFFDYIIMNPPFTRATGHEGNKIGVPNPMFAAFSSTKEEQQLMGKATERLTKGTSAHGNAGEASIFLVLADRKIKSGGTIALVLPLSFMSGEAWEDSRTLIINNYSDIILVSIAGTEGKKLSFSADTDMGECLLIGKKIKSKNTRAFFIILNERPKNTLIGVSISEQIRKEIQSNKIRCLEDGPVGGTHLKLGDDILGQIIEAPLPLHEGWHLSRISDLSLAQSAFQLVNNRSLWLPTMNKSESIPMAITTISEIGEIGPYHADINGLNSNGTLRGPFDLQEITPNLISTYPILWSHDAERERTLSFEADCEGIIRKSTNVNEQQVIEFKVENIWKSASHCHFNRDFRFNSQSTSMQFTTRKSIGGRAWLSIKLLNEKKEKALVLWANTSLGLLLYWWHSNKQQSGRGSVGKTTLLSFPVLDINSLNNKQLDEAVKLFDKIKNLELLPFHEINNDSIRKELDEKFCTNILGLPKSILIADGPIGLIRLKLSREPSIRGQK
jgi:surface antigen